jgi:hypothetical protein
MGGMRYWRPYVFSMGHTCGCWAVPVVDGGTRRWRGESEPRPSSWLAVSAPSFYGNSGVGRQYRRMGGGIVENEHDFHRVRFPDALAGHPNFWVPPWCSPFHSPLPSVKKLTHIPLERGGVRVGGSLRLGAVGIVVPCFVVTAVVVAFGSPSYFPIPNSTIPIPPSSDP